LKLDEDKIIGFLKVGLKKLFFWDELSKIHELNPLCVLDFYVNEEYQRNGFGKVLLLYN
jgi:alpha-tubulin N-acetyltransferase 1